MYSCKILCICFVKADHMLASVLSSCSDILAPQRYITGRPGQLQSTGCRCSPGARGRTPSIPELGALAVSELAKRLPRLGPGWKQREARPFIPLHPDAAAAHQMRDPVGFAPHGRGNLRHGQGAQYPSRARPLLAMETTMSKPNQSHGTGPPLRAMRRAKPFERQKLGNRLIRFPLAFQP
jgi:hypothetical protein